MAEEVEGRRGQPGSAMAAGDCSSSTLGKLPRIPSNSHYVNNHAQERQNPICFCVDIPRSPISSLIGSLVCQSCYFCQQVAVRKHNWTRPERTQLKSSLMALVFTREKDRSGSPGRGLRAEGFPSLEEGDELLGGRRRRRHFGLGGGSGGTRCAVRAPHGGWSGRGERPGRVGCLKWRRRETAGSWVGGREG